MLLPNPGMHEGLTGAGKGDDSLKAWGTTGLHYLGEAMLLPKSHCFPGKMKNSCSAAVCVLVCYISLHDLERRWFNTEKHLEARCVVPNTEYYLS